MMLQESIHLTCSCLLLCPLTSPRCLPPWVVSWRGSPLPWAALEAHMFMGLLMLSFAEAWARRSASSLLSTVRWFSPHKDFFFPQTVYLIVKETPDICFLLTACFIYVRWHMLSNKTSPLLPHAFSPLPLAALSLAINRDGSSGGVAYIVSIDEHGTEEKVVLGNDLPTFFDQWHFLFPISSSLVCQAAAVRDATSFSVCSQYFGSSVSSCSLSTRKAPHQNTY